VNLNIKVSKTLNYWFLLLDSFIFCVAQYQRFTARVFGHSANTPIVGRGGNAKGPQKTGEKKKCSKISLKPKKERKRKVVGRKKERYSCRAAKFHTSSCQNRQYTFKH